MSRLEEIKEHVQGLMDLITDVDGNGVANLQVIYNDMIWLIERVQELEEKNKRIRQMKYYEAYEQGKFDTNMKVWYEVPKLEQQNKRYREALSIISANLPLDEREHYVDIARQALEGET